MGLQKCTVCGECKEHNREFFHNAGRGKLRVMCRVCYNVRKRVWEDRRRRNNGTLTQAEIGVGRSERFAKRKMLFKEGCDKNGQLCGACGERKSVDEFYPAMRYSGGRRCISCSREYAKKYHKETYDGKKQYYKDYYEKNKARIIQNAAKYKKDNPDKVRKHRKKYTENTHVKIKRSQAARVRKALRSAGVSKSDKTLNYIGCTARELVAYLEGQFSSGMSWDNYGISGWHIDHIRPCASFDFSDKKQIHVCFHYTNLQPLWAADNMSKGDKWDG